MRWAIGSHGGREGSNSIICAAATGIHGDGWTSTLGGVAAANVIQRGVTGVVSDGGHGRSCESAGGGGDQDGRGVKATLGAGACCAPCRSPLDGWGLGRKGDLVEGGRGDAMS